MIVLVMLFVIFIYILLFNIVIFLGGKIADKLGYDQSVIKKRIRFICIAPILIWLLWDLPAIPLHKYYCTTQAGFFVYKTPEQWLDENSDLTTEELKPYGEDEEGKHEVLNAGTPKANSITKLNRRLFQSLRVEKPAWWNFFPVYKRIEYTEDSLTGEKLAELISFKSGYMNPIAYGGISGFKGWLSNTSCSQNGKKYLSNSNNRGSARSEYESYINKLTILGEEND